MHGPPWHSSHGMPRDRFSKQDRPNRERGSTPEGDLDAVPIEITYGFSKDGRPDLKQFVISMVMSDSLPVFINLIITAAIVPIPAPK